MRSGPGRGPPGAAAGAHPAPHDGVLPGGLGHPGQEARVTPPVHAPVGARLRTARICLSVRPGNRSARCGECTLTTALPAPRLPAPKAQGNRSSERRCSIPEARMPALSGFRLQVDRKHSGCRFESIPCMCRGVVTRVTRRPRPVQTHDRRPAAGPDHAPPQVAATAQTQSLPRAGQRQSCTPEAGPDGASALLPRQTFSHGTDRSGNRTDEFRCRSAPEFRCVRRSVAIPRGAPRSLPDLQSQTRLPARR